MDCKNNGVLHAAYRRRPRSLNVLMTTVIVFFALAATGYAHRVVVFAWIEGDTVYTQSKFPGGARVSEGDITVFDDTGRQVLTGKTDRQGEFSFSLKDVQPSSALKIVLNAGMGHQGHWMLTRQEVFQALGLETDADHSGDNDIADKVKQPVRLEAPQTGLEESGTCRIDEADLKKIVEEAVDRKLSPVTDMLIAIREEVAFGLDDVVAGVGYIFGLTGVLAWFYARKKE